ncbi:unnamed protein product [Acanthoscelides obtectus]|uniref:Uncharacterized protein n=1 Tax=Acanthoscelides obtectus TaxID=200917 RepID=A0A9P0PHW1_ACAOB|nr:unnamed protein product [Acanthoscelides obtectus]CAK1650896.1 hypothetical protein AOBTE_LOCUS16955 [Acanthoscelides obtectus]
MHAFFVACRVATKNASFSQRIVLYVAIYASTTVVRSMPVSRRSQIWSPGI